MLNLNALPGAQADEKPIAILRRHWISVLSLIASLIVVILLPLATVWAINYNQPEFFENPIWTTLFILGVSIFFLYSWLFLFQQFLDYYLDVWIVTSRRVLNIEQHGLFARTVSELRLHRIQDVTAEVKGFLPSMLDYGYVHIQTAGEQQRFEFEQIPHPNQVAKMILDMAEADRKSQFEEVVEDFGVSNKPNGTPNR